MIVKCKRCLRYRQQEAKGYCPSCYNHMKKVEMNNKLPKKKCECSEDCNTMIPILTINGKSARFALGHNAKSINNYKWKGYRILIGDYWYLYKPNYKYSYSSHRIGEHRYIMYIYMSILNNKVTYIEGFDVHHKNKDTQDNRIENLELLIRKEHINIHLAVDHSNTICSICGSKETYIKPDGKPEWRYIKNKPVCKTCYRKDRWKRTRK